MHYDSNYAANLERDDPDDDVQACDTPHVVDAYLTDADLVVPDDTALTILSYGQRAATKALAALGDTPDAVAAAIKAKGVTGVPCDSEQCPVSRALRRDLTDEVYRLKATRVYDSHAVVRHHEPTGVLADEIVDPVRLPAAVTEFVRNFDNKAYPDLIEPPKATA